MYVEWLFESKMCIMLYKMTEMSEKHLHNNDDGGRTSLSSIVRPKKCLILFGKLS